MHTHIEIQTTSYMLLFCCQLTYMSQFCIQQRLWYKLRGSSFCFPFAWCFQFAFPWHLQLWHKWGRVIWSYKGSLSGRMKDMVNASHYSTIYPETTSLLKNSKQFFCKHELALLQHLSLVKQKWPTDLSMNAVYLMKK